MFQLKPNQNKKTKQKQIFQQLMVNSCLPYQQKKKVNLIKVQFLEKEISTVATLCFSATL